MPKLVLDTKSEIYPFLKGIADEIFYDFIKTKIDPSSIYILGKYQVDKHIDYIHDLIDSKVKIIIAIPTEGGETIQPHIRKWRLEKALQLKQVLLLTGAKLDQGIPNFLFEWFLPKVFDYKENLAVLDNFENIYSSIVKPYFSLFLNGRHRIHRQYLIKRFIELKILNNFLYSNLDHRNGSVAYLPNEYEVEKFRPNQNLSEGFVKDNLFKGSWGEIYIETCCYNDTYFSLVTETSFQTPLSFRTEKIAKPLAAGHPFVVAANAGYYRDLKNLGFKTFSQIIDESFDTIQDNFLRLDRLINVIIEIKQNPLSFLQASKEICKYNQEFLREQSPKFNQDFNKKFLAFIKEHFNE